MHFKNSGATIFSLLAALTTPIAADADAYFILSTGMPVVIERVDPLLSAGKISNHVHSVVGGNGFAPMMDFAQTQTSDCSTVPVKVDKSNYWVPALYYKSPHNGSFIRVPEKPSHLIYYKYGKGTYTPDLERSEFPKEFRMITGNAMLRSNDGSSDNADNELEWFCHGPDVKSIGLPKFTSCPDGLAATIRFPSCWNGQDFDPAKPLAHMAFPGQTAGMAGCTAPYNVKRFPEIMIENWFDISTFDGDYGMNDSPWTLSMGDNTGYGFHADFINGWVTGSLQAVMKTCLAGNSDLPLDSSTCFGAGGTYDSSKTETCRVKNIVDEDVGLTGGESSKDGSKTRGGVLSHLPGCNPIQLGPGLATVQTNCPYSLPTGFGNGAALGSQPSTGNGSFVGASSAGSVASTGTMASTETTPTSMAVSASTAAAVQPSSASVVDQHLTNTPAMPIATATSQSTTTTSSMGSPSESATPTGSTSAGSSSSGSQLTASDGSTWDLAGCYTDQLNPVRSLGSSPEWWGQQITASNCVDRCSKLGMPMSGTENSGQCFCGTQLVGSTKVDSGECKARCEGDSSQTCGGPARISLYKKSSGGSKKQRTNRHLARHLEAVS